MISEDFDVCQAMVKGLVSWILTQEVTMGDIEKKQPRYFKAIMDKMKEVDTACVAHNQPQLEDHIKYFRGYYKKAVSLINKREGKK